MLTNRIHTYGFEIVDALLNREECDRLIARLSQINVSRSRAGARHLLSIAEVATLARDSRLTKIAGQALNSEPRPFRATLFEKSQNANWLVTWHQDTALPMIDRFEAAGWGPWSIKAGVHYVHAPAWALGRVVALRLHLDNSTAENGSLRVVPASHKRGLWTEDELGQIAETMPRIKCIVAKGGILAMFPLVVHASSKSKESTPRRVLHIEYADSEILADGVRLAVA